MSAPVTPGGFTQFGQPFLTETFSSFNRPPEPKAAIGFIYEDGDIVAGKPAPPAPSKPADAEEDSEASDVDSDADIGAFLHLNNSFLLLKLVFSRC